MTSKELKSRARRILKGNWSMLILAVCSMIFITVILSFIEYIVRKITGAGLIGSFYTPVGPDFAELISAGILTASFLTQYLLLSPLLFGIYRCLYRLAGGEKPAIGDLFLFYSSVRLYFRSVWCRISIFLRQILYLLVLMAPSSIISFLINGYAGQLLGYEITGALYSLLLFTAAALRLCALFIFIIVMLRYSLAGFIIASDNNLKINRGISMCVDKVNGHKTYIFTLILSFTAWLLLCLFIIPAVFVLPYFWGSLAIYARRVWEVN